MNARISFFGGRKATTEHTDGHGTECDAGMRRSSRHTPCAVAPPKLVSVERGFVTTRAHSFPRIPSTDINPKPERGMHPARRIRRIPGRVRRGSGGRRLEVAAATETPEAVEGG